MHRTPIAAYSAMQRTEEGRALSDIEVVVCDDGTVWTLRGTPDNPRTDWTTDGVPPIPGTYAALKTEG